MSEFCLTPSQTAELAFESRNKMRKNPNNLRRRLLLKQNYKSNYTRSLISLMAYRNQESDSEFHQEAEQFRIVLLKSGYKPAQISKIFNLY